jgi:hypothetical protein
MNHQAASSSTTFAATGGSNQPLPPLPSSLLLRLRSSSGNTLADILHEALAIVADDGDDDADWFGIQDDDSAQRGGISSMATGQNEQ